MYGKKEKSWTMKTYLDGGNMTIFSEIHPIGFVQLWTDQVSQIPNPIILPHQRC